MHFQLNTLRFHSFKRQIRVQNGFTAADQCEEAARSVIYAALVLLNVQWEVV
jgi:hypothetical protein